MDNSNKGAFDIYKDISARTNGEIYIGVVGGVRSGKSTFIKRFMELMVLPFMEDENEKKRAIDEMPQSAQGTTIMTTEPKFIPKEAAKIHLEGEDSVKVRMIDCVGYMVEGANGHMENGVERMVKTPWYDYEIPFTEAAELGTRKVINEHATIGIVVTTDGSISDIPRESYEKAEEQTIKEFQKAGKPFIVVLNSKKPFRDETIQLAEKMKEKYGFMVYPMNCEQLHKEDVNRILSGILYEFPVVKLNFFMPKWIEMLDKTNKIKANIIENAKKILDAVTYMKDVLAYSFEPEGEFLTKLKLEQIQLAVGNVNIFMDVDEKYYYENMSEMTGIEVKGEYQLIAMVKELAKMKQEYEKVADAMQAVKMKGYGVVNPKLCDINMEEPVIIKHGNKFGVKLKATSPSIHMIRANIETEIAPIVGSEEQAQDLINYIKEGEKTKEGVWQTNVFGKTLGDLMEDGIKSKISMMDDESQLKLQDTMQKIVNDSNGGLVCIII